MNTNSSSASRRDFVSNVGRAASLTALAACVPQRVQSPAMAATPRAGAKGWDLSWIKRVERASDRAVFDWPSLGDPADPIVLELAERYLDNCDAVYEPKSFDTCVVLNVRTQAVPAALVDDLWERYSLGSEYNVKDPTTEQPAKRNPFMYRAASPAPGIVMPTLGGLVDRGAIVLVCDFALGHLSNRLANKHGKSSDLIHRELRDGLVAGSFAVPSGIFGLARSQNSGCAFIRM
ncbi:MAG TPA: hypothetical protein VIP11_27720 [Gemmatimonadaceae bacterium]